MRRIRCRLITAVAVSLSAVLLAWTLLTSGTPDKRTAGSGYRPDHADMLQLKMSLAQQQDIRPSVLPLTLVLDQRDPRTLTVKSEQAEHVPSSVHADTHQDSGKGISNQRNLSFSIQNNAEHKRIETTAGNVRTSLSPSPGNASALGNHSADNHTSSITPASALSRNTSDHKIAMKANETDGRNATSTEQVRSTMASTGNNSSAPAAEHSTSPPTFGNMHRARTSVGFGECQFSVNMTRAREWTVAQLQAATYLPCFQLFRNHGGEEVILFKKYPGGNSSSESESKVLIVGGGSGREALWARQYWKSDVILIEPLQSACRAAALQFSHERRHVDIVCTAVGSEAGQAVMRRTGPRRGSVYAMPVKKDYAPQDNEELVKVQPILSILASSRWNDVKEYRLLILSCEGCEFTVVQHLASAGLLQHIQVIAVRIHCNRDIGFTMDKLFALRNLLALTHKLEVEYMCTLQKWTRI